MAARLLPLVEILVKYWSNTGQLTTLDDGKTPDRGGRGSESAGCSDG
jgi:hypothetical protein